MTRPWIVAAALLGCEQAPVVPPRVASEVAVPYPEELWDANVEGETLVRAHVNASGVADSVLVERSSGYPEFDQAAAHGVSGLKFVPGRRGTEATELWVRVPVQFRLQRSAS